MLSGKLAVDILSRYKNKIELYIKDNTDKFWSYRSLKNKAIAFAFDPKTKKKLNLRFNFDPTGIKGLINVENISNNSISTAIGRVFYKVDYSILYKGTFEIESDFIDFLNVISKNAGTDTKDKIYPTANLDKLDFMVSTLLKNGTIEKPEGNQFPQKVETEGGYYLRDPKVKAWVLQEAKGICEKCNCNAPFLKKDSTPYLEVHHLKRLSDSGSDSITNVVALCPNCHREFHYGLNTEKMKKEIINKIYRLVAE